MTIDEKHRLPIKKLALKLAIPLCTIVIPLHSNRDASIVLSRSCHHKIR